MTVSDATSKSSDGDRFLLLDDVIAFSELSVRYHWLSLVNQYQYSLKLKNSMPLNNLHLELQELMTGFDEFRDYDLSLGDPFIHLVKRRGLTSDEIMNLHGEYQSCVKVESLEEIVTTISKYNFFYKYKKIFGPFFKGAEKNMEVIAKRDHWPGRGSWNAFVPMKFKEKKELDLKFLTKYSPKPAEKNKIESKEEPIAESNIDNSNTLEDSFIEAGK